jgi:tetratricopeptide (TPR) repeat protein
MSDRSRIEDLRRRIVEDPASIAFAQLAEEYRRTGEPAEAVEVARAGLRIHPGYVSARVTLGRALLDLGELDDARAEFQRVLEEEPENLAALRSLAEIHQRHGNNDAALKHYQSAMSLAPNDPKLEQAASSVRTSAETERAERSRAERTIAALEGWLTAIHGSRTNRGA